MCQFNWKIEWRSSKKKKFFRKINECERFELIKVKKDPKIIAKAIKYIDMSVFNKNEDGIVNACLDKEIYKRKVSYYNKLTQNIKEILATLINEISITLLLPSECEEMTIHTKGYETVLFNIIPSCQFLKKVTLPVFAREFCSGNCPRLKVTMKCYLKIR